MHDMIPDLQFYFLREVLHTLLQIRCSLRSLSEDPSQRNHQKKIRRHLTGVRDLAMVHGFDGVEKIAGKLFANLEKALTDSKNFDAAFVSKLNEAVVTLERVVALEAEMEARMSIELINHDLRQPQPATKTAVKSDSKANKGLPGTQLALALNESLTEAEQPITTETPLRITDVGAYEEALSKAEDLDSVIPVRRLHKVPEDV